MTDLEALNLLVQAAGLARLTKQEHVQLEQAGQVLYEKLAPKEKQDKKKAAEGGGEADDGVS